LLVAIRKNSNALDLIIIAIIAFGESPFLLVVHLGMNVVPPGMRLLGKNGFYKK